MPEFSLSKAAAILIGLSILATSIGTIFAEDPPRTTTARPKTGIGAASVAINKNLLTQPRLTSKDIENKLASMKEKLASKEAVLRARLQTFKDQKKATAAARISTNLNTINQNQTTQMQKYLDIMSGILDKLEARVNQPTPDIKNPAAAKAAITSARATVASASAEVAAQAQKDYTIQATTEARIRIDAQAMRDKLHTDILSMRKGVVDTKEAVVNAIRVAKSGSVANPEPKDKEKEGTISGRE